MKRSFCSAALIVAVLTAVPLAPARAQDGPGLRIGPRDKIAITVEEQPTLTGDHDVADDGTISLPVIGSVRAQGLDERELSRAIAQRLETEGLRRATVTVKVLSYRSRPVSLLGAVGTPGNRAVPARITLLELLLEVGGLREDHGQFIQVRRRAENGLSDQIQISVDELIRDGNPAVNIPIFAGDVIHVPVTSEVQIHFLGEVKNPGTLTFRSTDQVTLLTAIARVGGLTSNATNKIRIRRHGAPAGTPEIVVDYRQVLSGKAPDPQLENGDLIIVKEAFF